ncbi:MAG: prevent-host-death protein [Verrucomicrobia bacterium RIFCSPHIGHO2_12_FULL_41_10]|nr:MAG: prevent-host-death protein [Verrucomicrobia bacterium RIFCSPHIGHO2_12_FULL_41_10]HLB33619.1 type II toxin-antitoxin system prevent-host-death family antitoxin [Chthoniobacterales bacterium]
MTTISYTEARESLATIWDKTVSTREPMIISRPGTESLVIMPIDEWSSMKETAYLLRSPANARRLLGALDRIEQGEGENLTIEELKTKVGLE